jgi:hypothetical protein
MSLTVDSQADRTLTIISPKKPVVSGGGRRQEAGVRGEGVTFWLTTSRSF